MKKWIITCAFALMMGALVGCQGSTEATSGTDKPGESNAAAKPGGGEATNTNATSTGGETTAEMGKCAGCGKEVAVADLKDHDGAKMCAACIAAHNH